MTTPVTAVPSTAAVPDIAVAVAVDRKGKGKSRAVHHLSAGALSGFTSAIILQPLDLLKTRLQQASPSGIEEVGAKRYVPPSFWMSSVRSRGFWRENTEARDER